MKRKIAGAFLLLFAMLALADCGKKGNPQPPAGVPNIYPRIYPSD